ncbi:TetR/AcrR family transcriptional regulator [Limosilactobacillus oris]|uniref:TetR/AcrR family transcriptional regulator n=1 Tax=Limosilactobacillus oris TaxID=1632 RepID=UPI002235CFE8|nr:TetR/AcrR family transcriptional regulator [Limosilactobacillus oris]MCW4388604.1 TetR/AcrR family transcriptional regulator [Limosilactobacillus oris]
MANTHNNQRARKTKQVIASKFIELLQTKPVNKITVTELTSLCRINRGTFYQYYRDPYDLLEKLCHNLIIELTEAIKFNQRDLDIPMHLMCMLKVIQKHRTIAKVCLANLQSDKEFYMAFNEIKQVSFALFKKDNPLLNDFECELQYTFFTQGSLALILEWLNKPNNLSIDDVAQLLTRLYVK